jgi:hypothetical protein
MSTIPTLVTPKDVQSVGEETLAFYIYESDIEVSDLSADVLRSIVSHIKPVRDELGKEYTTGDPLCYPPDWYDSYVFPLDCAISKCQAELAERNRFEDSEGDSEW